MGGFTNTSGGIKLMRETQFTYQHGDRPRVSTSVLIREFKCPYMREYTCLYMREYMCPHIGEYKGP